MKPSDYLNDHFINMTDELADFLDADSLNELDRKFVEESFLTKKLHQKVNDFVKDLPFIDFLQCPYCGNKFQIPIQTNDRVFCCHNTIKKNMKKIRLFYGIEEKKKKYFGDEK